MPSSAQKISLTLGATVTGVALCALFAVSDTERLASLEAYLSSREAVSAARSGDTDSARKLWEQLADGSTGAVSTPSEARAEALVALGNLAYDEEDFEAARDSYLRASPGRTEWEFRRLHNLGNAEYRLGEREKFDANRIVLWGSAVDRYERALAWRDDPQTRENLEFVKKKLQELAEKAKQDGSSGQDSQSGSGSQGGQAGGSSERPPQSGGVWRNSGSFDRVGRQDGDEGGLSDSERAGLEARMRAIDELGRNGQEYLRRDGTPSSVLDGPILGDMRMLQDSQSGVEKDW